MGADTDSNLASWRKQRNSGLTIIFFGIFALLITFLIYGRSSNIVITSESYKVLLDMAIALYILLAIALIATAFGIYRIYRSEKLRITFTNDNKSARSIIVKALEGRKYSMILKLSAAGYGIFYAFITSLLVYRPNEVFSQVYGASIPSWRIIPCCGTSGYIPIFVGYITEQFGFLVIPVNLILLLVVSALVGINTALAVFAYDNRPKNATASWVGGFGAITGLFTGCPTCAGTFFATMFGLGLSTTSALALAPLQSLFVGVSIPVLFVTALLTARNLKRSIYGCSID